MEITQKEAKDAMKNTFCRLMLLPAAGEVRWLGTVSDLVELVHIMWYDGLTIDEHGQVLNFSTSVNRLCERLGLRAPRKPNTVMNNIRNRKNYDRMLIVRCQHLMEQGEEPLARFIKEEEGREEEGSLSPDPSPKGRGVISGNIHSTT